MGDARMKFDILYYIIGLLYLIFDLEIIFLFPLGAIL
jgi:NADH:ubiquinone oxidoreductase subunit 3 (subunit A)